MNTTMDSLPLALVEIYDTDADHEVGGQDLPYLVTASYEGDYQCAADQISADESLEAFNVQPAITRSTLAGHIEFCTFQSRAIYRFFGVSRPPSPDEERARRYWQSTYARTVGDLRAALADLPDDFPLIHTGYDERLEAKNRLGVHITANRWEWTTADCPRYGLHGGWALRIAAFDLLDWNQIARGLWKDKRYADID